MTKFISFSTYNKHQAILTSGRLIFNAREDNLFLLSKKDIALSSGGDIHINVGPKGSKNNILIVNSPKIQFGLDSVKNPLESVAKGDSAVNSLNSLINLLVAFMASTIGSTAVGGGGVSSLPAISNAADEFIKRVEAVKKDLEKIKSSTTFTV